MKTQDLALAIMVVAASVQAKPVLRRMVPPQRMEPSQRMMPSQRATPSQASFAENDDPMADDYIHKLLEGGINNQFPSGLQAHPLPTVEEQAGAQVKPSHSPLDKVVPVPVLATPEPSVVAPVLVAPVNTPAVPEVPVVPTLAWVALATSVPIVNGVYGNAQSSMEALGSDYSTPTATATATIIAEPVEAATSAVSSSAVGETSGGPSASRAPTPTVIAEPWHAAEADAEPSVSEHATIAGNATLERLSAGDGDLSPTQFHDAMRSLYNKLRGRPGRRGKPFTDISAVLLAPTESGDGTWSAYPVSLTPHGFEEHPDAHYLKVARPAIDQGNSSRPGSKRKYVYAPEAKYWDEDHVPFEPVTGGFGDEDTDWNQWGNHWFVNFLMGDIHLDRCFDEWYPQGQVEIEEHAKAVDLQNLAAGKHRTFRKFAIRKAELEKLEANPPPWLAAILNSSDPSPVPPTLSRRTECLPTQPKTETEAEALAKVAAAMSETERAGGTENKDT